MFEVYKLGNNFNKLYEIDGNFNPCEKELFFEMSIKQFNEITGLTLAEVFLNPDKVYEKIKTIFIQTKDDKIFSCFNCIFSFNVNDVVSFKMVSVDCIIENEFVESPNCILINKLTFKTKYLGKTKHRSYIKNLKFKYDTYKTIELKVYTVNDSFIELTVYSNKQYNYNKLSKIIYSMIELITLIIGDTPIIDEVYYYNSLNEKMKLYFSVVDKYSSDYVAKNCTDVLGYIDENTINKKTIKDFIKFRKGTKIIYDLFLININNPGYKELANCNFVQIIEGLYKSIIGGKEKCLVEEIRYMCNRTRSTKKILNNKDKRKINSPEKTEIFIYKAKNQRHYLSHLNSKENKNVFYGLENIYAYWKLSLIIRLFILDYLNINYQENLLDNYLKMINNWAKDKKIRFNLKLNS